MSPARRLPAPNSCRHCGLDRYDHARQRTTHAGWHTWTAPDQALIKARMLTRRPYRPR
ncbi:hypothetical protein ACIQVO_36555 [Streptomyces sp. NPDC101062]|uniref:hypothetical protein n=1 Tax=unclassified Streptomyces TaxID=2593676 RepID=UPI0037FFF906